MNRRCFIAHAPFIGSFAAAPSLAFAMGERNDGENYGVSKASSTVVESLGGMTLAGLREYHLSEVEAFAAHWETGGIDDEFGGFIPHRNDHNTAASDDKQMYYLGRGLWIFSYLYNHFGKRDRHREAARKCWEFMRHYCRDEKTGYWLARVTRDGKPLKGPIDIYGDMYVILGLTEYYRIAEDPSLLDIAVETAHGIDERIVSADYQHLDAHKSGFEPGTKILGTWQHFLGSLTPLARESHDDGAGLMARMCVRNIMERHFSHELGVFFEYLDGRFLPFPVGYDPELRKISSWHSVQSAWMCLDEALRTGDRAMFGDALEMGRRTFDNCWLEGDEGGLIGLDYPGQDIRESSDTPQWERLDDAMVFALLAVEHTHAPWAIYWFNKIFAHAMKKPEKFNRNSLLHYPRRLFFVIEILDRMIARGGRVSDFFAG